MNLGLLIVAAPVACWFVFSVVMAVRGPRRRPDPYGYLTYEPEDAEPSAQDLADEVEAWLLAREDFR